MKTLSYYKGGVNKLLRRLYDSSKYRQWRLGVFERDDYICQNCRSNGRVEAHHKEMFSLLFERLDIRTYRQAYSCNELWDIENGITLCKKCHSKTKKGNPNLYR